MSEGAAAATADALSVLKAELKAIRETLKPLIKRRDDLIRAVRSMEIVEPVLQKHGLYLHARPGKPVEDSTAKPVAVKSTIRQADIPSVITPVVRGPQPQ